MKSKQTIYSGKWIKFLFVALFCFMLFPAVSGALPGEKITSFSADQVVLSPDGKVLKTSKAYITPAAFRVDTTSGNKQSDKLTVIGLEKQNKQYIYNLDKKIYFESTLDEAPMLLKLDSYRNVDSAQIIGEEKVCGYPCVKKKVTLVVPMMGIENSTKVIIWQSDRFEFPLKTQTVGGPIGEFRNIDTSEPDKKLFRRQVGYKEVDNMLEAMGMGTGIDSAAMAAEIEESDDEDLESDPKNDEDVGLEQVMAGIQESIDAEEFSPEVRKILAQTVKTGKQIHMDKGVAVGIWEVIPKRSGDEVLQELKTPHVYQVVMGSNAPLKDVFTFYEKNLMPQGWEDKGMYIQDGMGAFTLWSEQHRLVISWSDGSGTDGNYKFFYSLQLSEIIE